MAAASARAPLGGGRLVMNREEVDRALARLGAEHDAIERALLSLQDHSGRRLLEGAELDGTTRARWSDAEQRIALLWSYFQTYHEALSAARTRRERGGRRPGQAALAELTELLSGTGITVPGGPDAPGGAALTEQLSLASLVERMNTWYGQVMEVAGAADAVWSALPARIDLLIAEAGRVHARAAAVGLRPGEHPIGDALQQLSSDLDALRTQVRADPLAFRTSLPGQPVDTARFDRAARELEEVREEVEALLRLRDDAEDRLASVADLLAGADARLAEARQVRGEVLAKITASDVPAVPGPPLALYDRLARAGQFRGRGQWQRLAPLLDGLEQEAEEEVRRAGRALTAVRAPLALRDELRGRLDAYRAKAGSKGRLEDPELAEAYQHARRVLWSAPCDLRTAESAVARYQHVLARLTTPHPGPTP